MPNITAQMLGNTTPNNNTAQLLGALDNRRTNNAAAELLGALNSQPIGTEAELLQNPNFRQMQQQFSGDGRKREY